MKATILATICCVLSSTTFYAKTTTYTYEKAKEGVKTTTTWTITQKAKDQITLIAKNKEFSTKIKADKNYNTKKYAFSSDKTHEDYTLRSEGSSIIAKGIIKGRQRTKTIKLGKNPWLQDFCFNLTPFISSSAKEFAFSMIYPADFSLIDMIAKKQERAKITLANKEYDAQKIYLTLPGFKGKFWSAELWYDLKNKNMLLFIANEGPGTPITTIIFTGKK